jgi:drug/metabolite transporter (DMT)-like permease
MQSDLSRDDVLEIAAAFAGIYLIWGTTYLAIAIAIQTLPPFVSGAARFLLAGALMYAWLRRRTSAPMAGVSLRAAAWAGVLLSGIGNGFVIWSQQGIPSGIAALMVAAVPVVVLLLDWAFFSKRVPGRAALTGTAIAVAGVVTIVLHTRTLAGAVEPLHVAALLAAVIGWSVGTLLQQRHAKKETVLSFTCAQMLFGGVFQLALSFADGEWRDFILADVSAASLAALAYLIVFGSIVGLNCYLYLLTRVATAKVTTYALVNPVVALILGAIVLGERITSLAVVAALLVLGGVALVLFERARPAAAVQRDAPNVGLHSRTDP